MLCFIAMIKVLIYFRIETLENIAAGINSPAFNKWDVSLGLIKTHLQARQ